MCVSRICFEYARIIITKLHMLVQGSLLFHLKLPEIEIFKDKIDENNFIRSYAFCKYRSSMNISKFKTNESTLD
jgi:hypothetical protein